MPAVTIPQGVILTDRSGTITAGGTAQTAVPASRGRVLLLIQNPSSEVESLWFSTEGTATAASPSIELQPGQTYESAGIVPTGAVSVIAATTNHPFTIKVA